MDKDEQLDENVTKLINMGFDAKASRDALLENNNDIETAVNTTLMAYEKTPHTVPYNPPPPAYPSPIPDEMDEVDPIGSFASASYNKLKGKVTCHNWVVPVKDDEELALCLSSATDLVQMDDFHGDPLLDEFVNTTVHECFQKLMKGGVRGWEWEVQESIRPICSRYIRLVVERLKHEDFPWKLLETLAMIFDPSNDWNEKNRKKMVCQDDVPYCEVPGEFSKFGWLLTLINDFFHMDGPEEMLSAVKNSFLKELVKIKSKNPLESANGHQEEAEGTTEEERARKREEREKKRKEKELKQEAKAKAEVFDLHKHALKPMCAACEYLNEENTRDVVEPFVDYYSAFISQFSCEDCMQNKVRRNTSEILEMLRPIYKKYHADDMEGLNGLRLNHIKLCLTCSDSLATIKDALCQLTAIIETFKRLSRDEYDLEEGVFRNWLQDEGIIKLALDSNMMDKQAVSEGTGKIVSFVGGSLKADNLTKIWEAQMNTTPVQAANVRSILAKATKNFNQELAGTLLELVNKTWTSGDEESRCHVLTFLEGCGEESSKSEHLSPVLESLWNIARREGTSKEQVESALEKHARLLEKVAYKRREEFTLNYARRCIEDIRNERFEVHALHHMRNLLSRMLGNRQSKARVREMASDERLCDVTLRSMERYHVTAVAFSKHNPSVATDYSVIVQDSHSHKTNLDSRLNLLKFLIHDCDVNLSWEKVQQLWDPIAGQKDSFESNKSVCCFFFYRLIEDLEDNVRDNFFRERLLKLDPVSLNKRMFNCVLKYLETANLHEEKITEADKKITVADTDLIGIEYLWKVLLHCGSKEVVSSAKNKLVDYHFVKCNQDLRKNASALHNKFFRECLSRLQEIEEDEGVLAKSVANAAKVAINSTMPDIDTQKSALKRDKTERILGLINKYVSESECEYDDHERRATCHYLAYESSEVQIDVQGTREYHAFKFHAASNYPVFKIKMMAAERCGKDFRNVSLEAQYDRKLKNERNPISRYTNNSNKMKIKIITVRNRRTAPNLLGVGEPLPSYLLARGENERIYDFLFKLSSNDNTSVNCQIKSILDKMPTCPALIRNFKNLLTYDLNGSGDSSSQVSEVKSAMRRILSPQRNNQINLFALRYKLETLGHLVETEEEFLKFFMRVDGLNFLLKLLREDLMNQEGEKDKMSLYSCFVCTLQMIRRLLQRESGMNEEKKSSLACSPRKDENRQFRSPKKKRIREDDSPKRSGESSNFFPFQEAINSKLVIHELSKEQVRHLAVDLLQICWYAAAEKLHQVKPHREEAMDDSNNSNNSNSPFSGARETKPNEVEVYQCEHYVAEICLDIINACLKHRRNFIREFFEIRSLGKMVIDILVKAPLEIREISYRQLLAITHFEPDSDYDKKREGDKETDDVEERKEAVKFVNEKEILKILRRATLAYWNSDTNLRSQSRKEVDNCAAYFKLREKLSASVIRHNSEGLDDDEDAIMELSEDLAKEVEWCENWDPPLDGDDEQLERDDELVSGHFSLMSALVDSPFVDKTKIATDNNFLEKILKNFLFKAASTSNNNNNDPTSFMPICRLNRSEEDNFQSRHACFKFVYSLCKNNAANTDFACRFLIEHNHKLDVTELKEMNLAKHFCNGDKMVGLVSQGATCYLNSIVQQIFNIKQIVNALLSHNMVEMGANDPEQMLHSFQLALAMLQKSHTLSYKPEGLWNTFRFTDPEMRVNAHQDAQEFLIGLIDKIDELAKKNNLPEVFAPVMKIEQAVLKTCRSCGYMSDPKISEENSINLKIVEKPDLHSALKQNCRENNINDSKCEKCGVKGHRERTVYRKFGDVICFQLSRFEMTEYYTSRKIDSYFKFDLLIDMAAYTSTGKKSNANQKDLFELIGVVIHQGTTVAGHYTSVVKNQSGRHPAHGQWFYCNDEQVTPFDIEDQLERECFGGEDNRESGSKSAYLLFYQRKKDSSQSAVQSAAAVPKQADASANQRTLPSNRRARNTSISQLSNLVRKSEQRGVFGAEGSATSALLQNVVESNRQLYKYQSVYNHDYIRFVRCLIKDNKNAQNDRMLMRLAANCNFVSLWSVPYGFHGLDICDQLCDHMDGNEPACIEMVDYFCSNFEVVTYYTFKNFDNAIPHHFLHILELMFSHLDLKDHEVSQKVTSLFKRVVSMLDDHDFGGKPAKEYERYFLIIYKFASKGSLAMVLLNKLGLFKKLMFFLFGRQTTDFALVALGRKSYMEVFDLPDSGVVDECGELTSHRKWTFCLNTPCFLRLHKIMHKFVVAHDMSGYREGGNPRCGLNEELVVGDEEMLFCEYVKLEDYEIDVSLNDGVNEGVEFLMDNTVIIKRYVRELVYASALWPMANYKEEQSAARGDNCFMFVMVYCCYCNVTFSDCTIDVILRMFYEEQVNDQEFLSNMLGLLKKVLCLCDSLQRHRVTYAFEACNYFNFFNQMDLLRRGGNDGKLYKIIKFITELYHDDIRCQQVISEFPYHLFTDSIEWLRGKLNSQANVWESPNSRQGGWQRTSSKSETFEKFSEIGNSNNNNNNQLETPSSPEQDDMDVDE